ncbi:hypothetical protein [Nitrosomonas supralitoralis]|uniref:Class I SAM-dependent methyltransferase n=1 Tax=Nitrosomonas supralitoralis TaxID=2116706 RepID=A0A2P7NWM3_9PROT|nr:hypothetical protein [Nitrosomonas supralitoralis]PSJ17866.1 hypothetical protein C7H79_05640 [Nitrosomonas supralitoralis]
MSKIKHTVTIALLIQIFTSFLIAFSIGFQSVIDLSILDWAILQGLLAGLVSLFLRMPMWWIPIHLIFMPLTIAVLALNISSNWFLVLFLCLLSIYGKTYKTQVPLYLSSKSVNQALTTLLPQQGIFSFIDLGSGCGGLVNNLANTHKNGLFYGIEYAPLPFLISKLRSIFSGSTSKIVWGDFWNHDFSSYDVVYAYLSPVPMASLWQKATKEMRPGSFLISNTFIIPDIPPDKSIKLDDFSNSTLYLWKIRI